MIRFEPVSAGYGDTTVVRDFSLDAVPGECILLSGRNGSGKTTLMKTLAGLIPPLKGTLPQAEVVMVPTRIPKVKGFTVREFIALTASGPERVSRALEILGIEDLSTRDLSTLSDGQFQKACIATGLSRQADLVLLDEPTAFLDAESRVRILEAIKRAALASGSCILFSSHDLHEARKVADREITLLTDQVTGISAVSPVVRSV